MAETFFVKLVHISAMITSDHGIVADDINQAHRKALRALREIWAQGQVVFEPSEWRLEIRNNVGELVQSFDIPDRV